MKVLFITTAQNSMSQRACAELTDKGHEVSKSVIYRHEARAAMKGLLDLLEKFELYKEENLILKN